MPFDELPHTADWSIRVWANSLPELFAESARGMNSLSGAKPLPGVRISRAFTASAPEPESLLIAFLSELVYEAEHYHRIFDEFKIDLEIQNLNMVMMGSPILSINKSIKAVTYHNLQIRSTPAGFEVEIVFDV
jgi:SHS2 domain-containing protein